MFLEYDNKMLFITVDVQRLHNTKLRNFKCAHTKDIKILSLNTVDLFLFLGFWFLLLRPPGRFDVWFYGVFDRIAGFLVTQSLHVVQGRRNFSLWCLGFFILNRFNRSYDELFRQNAIRYNSPIKSEQSHHVGNVKVFADRLTGSKSPQKTLVLQVPDLDPAERGASDEG